MKQLSSFNALDNLSLKTMPKLPAHPLMPCLLSASLLDLMSAAQRSAMPLIAKLVTASSLVSLNLSKTKISDNSLPTLQKLKNLRELSLSSTEVTDKGVHALKNLRLRTLDLSDTKITNKATASFKGAPFLSIINLSKNNINDQCSDSTGSSACAERTLHCRHKIGDEGLKTISTYSKVRKSGHQRYRKSPMPAASHCR